MASRQLIGCDFGRVQVFLEYDGVTREVTGLRGFNRSEHPVTVIIDRDARDRETTLTIPAGTNVEATAAVAVEKRWNLTAPADSRVDFVRDLEARALYPGG